MEVEILQLAWLAREGWSWPVLHLPRFFWPRAEASPHSPTALQCYWHRTRHNCCLPDRNCRFSRKEWRTGPANAREGASSLLAAVLSAQSPPGQAGQNAAPTAGQGAPALYNRNLLWNSSLCFRAILHRKGHSQLMLLYCETAASGCHNH